MIVQIDGIKGSGKSTVIQRLSEKIIMNGKRVAYLQSLGYDKIGQFARKIIKDGDGNPLQRFFLARASYVGAMEEAVQLIMYNTDMVLMDRGILSNFAYQLVSDKIDERLIMDVDFFMRVPRDLVLLKADPDHCIERVRKRVGETDAVFSGNVEYEMTIQDAMQRYGRRCAVRYPLVRFHEIDATQSIEKVVDAVYAKVG